MKNKKIKKIVSMLSLIVALSIPTVAFADTLYTGDFSYGAMAAHGALEVSWSATSYDNAKAWTAMNQLENYNYVATAYVEAQMNSSGTDVRGARFDYGSTYAEVNCNDYSGVWRFNSTHSIANKYNVYVAYVSQHLSDW
jgi:hypothetical protein